MKKSQVQVGETYIAKVSGTLTTIRILRDSPYGGWDAVNTKTGREVRVKTAARLRRPALTRSITPQEVEAATIACRKMLSAPSRPVEDSPASGKEA
jgi:hypothetical protein